jgi:hypothetical protein
MSLLDTASLVITPNGYKEGKLYSVVPSDGSGDMTVTRATTATRVNSAGLVELVPYNLLSYSEQFNNGAWSTSQATLTSGQTGYDGSSNAYKLQATGTSCYIAQGSYNFTRNQSVYAKAGNYSQLSFIVGGYGTGVRFDLTSGTIADNTNASYFTPTIESVGNGWYRCSVSISSTAPTYAFLIAPNYVAGSNSTSGDYIYIQNAQLVEGSTAKDYQKTETRLNIPRLDYSNGTCPSILVEPQRTNLLTYSSSFDNAVWEKINSGTSTTPIVTANYSNSPDGTQNADRIQFSADTNSGSNYSIIFNNCSLSSTGTATIWLKSNTSSNQNVVMYRSTGQGQVIVVTPTWQRFTLSNLSSGSGNLVFGTRGGSGNFYNGGDANLDILAWGAQVEAGSYATSYIPTTSASVTRNADVISKTGISSLIGQTEGTVFVEMYNYGNSTNTSNVPFSISNGNYGDAVYFEQFLGLWYVSVFVGFNLQFQQSAGALSIGYHKLAIGYKQNNFAFYVDGVLIANGTSGNIPSCSRVDLGTVGISTNPEEMQIKTSALWKTRLTNTQLAQLTTI